MMTIIIVSVTAAVILGVLSTITDIRFHKVKNAHIVFFVCLGISLQVVTAVLDSTLLFPLIINLFLAGCISIALYALKIWAAGDAKLCFTMAMLLPPSMMIDTLGGVIPALVMLGITFTIAMLYVAIESVVLLLRDLKRNGFEKKAAPKGVFSKTAILSWITAYFIIDFVDSLVKLIGNGSIFQIPYLSAIFNLLLANASLLLFKGNKIRMIVSGTILAVRITLTILHVLTMPVFSVWTGLIIIGLHLFRRFTGRYDYRMIQTETVAEGQVLAQSTIAVFLLSKGEGLPVYSDESTRCRLTRDEASAVRAWGKTKHGKPTIMIVRVIPFAPFIFLGLLASVAMCVLI